MSSCGLTRVLGLAWLVGFAVSTLVGSSPGGWVAGLLTLAVLAAVQRRRGTGGSCAISLSGSTEVASRAASD